MKWECGSLSVGYPLILLASEELLLQYLHVWFSPGSHYTAHVIRIRITPHSYVNHKHVCAVQFEAIHFEWRKSYCSCMKNVLAAFIFSVCTLTESHWVFTPCDPVQANALFCDPLLGCCRLLIDIKLQLCEVGNAQELLHFPHRISVNQGSVSSKKEPIKAWCLG